MVLVYVGCGTPELAGIHAPRQIVVSTLTNMPYTKYSQLITEKHS